MPTETQQARTLADGTQVATFRAQSFPRTMMRAIISGGPVGSTCLVYVGQIGSQGFRDGSSTGNQDVWVEPAGLHIPAGENLYFVWSTSTSQGQAVVQWG